MAKIVPAVKENLPGPGPTVYCARRCAVFGPLGMPEIIMIFIVGLLLFGPRKMPQIGRSIGRALGEFRRASNEFKRTVEDEVASEEIRSVEKDLREIKNTGTDVLKKTLDSASMDESSAPEEKSDS